ncbi:glycosyltransferase family 4 protein [Methylocystis sp.]|uniref:glycosyltransferase family 4 protein n=1 Tax=Methylocystis sp. TaxID=1911079 RepID=UPI003DA51D4F
MLKQIPPSFLLGSATLRAGNGGIARVGRLTARALLDTGADVRLLSLGDYEAPEIMGCSATIARGSKLRFWLHCQMAALSKTHFVYDCPGVARAHPHFISRPYAVWLAGLEACESIRPEIDRALRRADLVLAISNYALARFEALRGPLPQAQVCWLGTEDDDEPAAPEFAGPPTALILARMWEEEGRKGHAELIGCWPYVLARIPNARLLVVGGGKGRANLEAAAGRSLASRQIEFTGYVPEAEIDRVWGQAHLLAMPSRQEGFGMVYIEAMRRGLPVIASRHDAGQEVNVDNETGFNVDLDRPAELVDRLARLLGNPTQCAEMGAAGRRRWRKHFRYSAFASRVSEHIRVLSCHESQRIVCGRSLCRPDTYSGDV